MKSTSIASVILLLCAFGANANAQPKTKEQVRNELAEAIRSGDIATGESSLSLRELYPQRYPAVMAVGKTRAQVMAELAEAIRNGDVAFGESSLTLRELHAQRYPMATLVTGKTREQVRTELAEAIRTGDVIANGESGLKLNELYPSHYAKARASVPDGMEQAASANGSAMP